jgi:hypothetical protein
MIDLSSEIADALDGFTDDVAKALEETKKGLAISATKEVKAKAPVRYGKYKKSLKYKKQSDGVYVVYSDKQYRLTHLLEHGHAKQSGGRTQAQPHWKPAEDLILRQAAEVFKRELK